MSATHEIVNGGCGCGGHAVEEKKTVSIHTATVHEIVSRFPQAKEVFLKNGFDLCCNAALTVDEQAAKRGLPTEKIYTELEKFAAAGV